MTLLQFFYVIGIAFGLIFLFLNVSVFFGGDSDMDSDIDLDDGDLDHGDGVFGSLLTLRSLINFLTFFGWGGVFMVNQGYSPWMSILVAAGAAFVFTIIFASIMFGMKKLQAAPKDVTKDDLLNAQATVYLILPGGTKKGKIQLSVRGAFRTIDALSENGEKIETGSQVIVTEFISDNLVKVKKI